MSKKTTTTTRHLMTALLVLVVCKWPLILGDCRVGSTSCTDDDSCWSSASNTSTPTNCKCCRGFPFHPHGECHRECSRNSDLYLLQLQQHLSSHDQAHCRVNGLRK